ncbi:MAG: hypothetical protein JRL30_00330 [Deltaproteobacteria bacterium]|nr:hypothetical protein [Deltaproteobacteria bacterium]
MSWKTIKPMFRARVVPILIAFSLIFAFQTTASFGEEVTPEDEKAYKEALEDTEVAEQTEISTRLLAVVPWYDTLNDEILHGSSITWENPADPANSRVLVETMVSQKDYEDYYEPYLGGNTTLNFSNWVTVVPELKNYFIGKSCPPTLKRIKQLIGLNPAREYSWLLEIWVHPKDLFRPAPDPEITDHEGELSVKIAQDNWTFPSDDNAFVTLIDEALYLEKGWTSDDPVKYRTWFIDAAQTYYDTTGKPIEQWGSPWTRLGYTYDWGNSDDHHGVSEFRLVLNVPSRGLAVGIKDAVDLSDYGQRASYFRCSPAVAGAGSGGCFVKAPH